jgi:Zn-dependent protease with chaperone function
MTAGLERFRRSPPPAGEPAFGYPGERGALYLSLALCLVILALLGALTVGLFLLAVAANLLYLILTHLTIKSQMIQASENSFERVHRLAKVAAYRLGAPLPPVYITEAPTFNAYTAGFFRYGFAVIHSAMVRDFKPDELLFVIGHEFGHIKRYHTTWLNLMHPAQGTGARFFVAPLMRLVFNVWSVKSEYTADQAGLIACRSHRAAVTAMLKLAGGAEVEKEVDVRRVEELASEDPGVSVAFLEYLGTHPFVRNRIRQLLSFAASADYDQATR